VEPPVEQPRKRGLALRKGSLQEPQASRGLAGATELGPVGPDIALVGGGSLRR